MFPVGGSIVFPPNQLYDYDPNDKNSHSREIEKKQRNRAARRVCKQLESDGHSTEFAKLVSGENARMSTFLKSSQEIY